MISETRAHVPWAVPRSCHAFAIVQNLDGDYRTKRVILDIYDAMAESILTGRPYQTRPGPTRAAAIR